MTNAPEQQHLHDTMRRQGMGGEAAALENAQRATDTEETTRFLSANPGAPTENEYNYSLMREQGKMPKWEGLTEDDGMMFLPNEGYRGVRMNPTISYDVNHKAYQYSNPVMRTAANIGKHVYQSALRLPFQFDPTALAGGIGPAQAATRFITGQPKEMDQVREEFVGMLTTETMQGMESNYADTLGSDVEMFATEMGEIVGDISMFGAGGMRTRALQLDPAKAKTFMTGLAKRIDDAFAPGVVAGEVMYALDPDNMGVEMAGMFEAMGFEGETLDFLKTLDENPQTEAISALVMGAVGFEVLRMVGRGTLKMSERATRGLRKHLADQWAGMQFDLDMVQRVMPVSLDTGAFPRLGTTGQYRAGPPNIKSPQALTALFARVKDLALEGEPGKEWYAKSGQAILEAVGGDLGEADKMARILAITSQGTGVKTNMKFALDAMSQHAGGQPIKTGRFPVAQSKKIEDVLAGREWDGQKTNSFYINLMQDIDPSKVAGLTTQDIWMARAFGYAGDTFSGGSQAGDKLGSYAFAEKMTQQMADELGWEPQQVQAAIWTAAKARWEGTAGQAKALAKKRGIDINSPKYMALWRKLALGQDDMTPKQIKDAAYDFADAFKDQSGQISFEAIPGRSTNHLPWLHDQPPEVRAEYNYRMMNTLLDNNGRDILADALKMPHLPTVHGFGGWGGDINLSGQARVAMPGKVEGMTEAGENQVRAYAATLGGLFKQEGVGYHKPMPEKTQKASNGVHFMTADNKPLDEAQTKALYDKVIEISGDADLAPIPSADGVRFLNFSGDNKEFHKVMQQAWDEAEGLPNAKMGRYTSQGDLIENDWSKDSDGQGYRSILSDTGFTDSVTGVVDVLKTRMGQVEADFAQRYGADQ